MDLGGSTCGQIYATTFGMPKVFGDGRSNYHRDAQRKCLQGYREAELEWCQTSLHEFRLIRSQKADSQYRRWPTAKNSSEFQVEKVLGAHTAWGMADRLTTKDLESFAGLTPEELRREYAELTRQGSAIERERRIVLTLLDRYQPHLR